MFSYIKNQHSFSKFQNLSKYFFYSSKLASSFYFDIFGVLDFKIAAMPLPKKIDKKINAGTKCLGVPAQPVAKTI